MPFNIIQDEVYLKGKGDALDINSFKSQPSSLDLQLPPRWGNSS